MKISRRSFLKKTSTAVAAGMTIHDSSYMH